MHTSLAQHDGWWREYANDPLTPTVARDVANDVGAYLEEAALQWAMPDEIVALDALPRTVDGTLDLARLPRREASRPASAGGTEPVGPIETALATLWRQILEVDVVGRHDNFFDLGGDSMRGMQVVAHARRVGLDFELRHLMEHQTIAGLAAEVSRAGVGGTRPNRMEEPTIVHGAIPLPIPHKRLIEEGDERYFVERIDVYRFACRRLMRVGPLGRTIEHLFSHHDALRIELRREADGIALWNSETVRATSELLWTFDLSQLEEAERNAEIDRISSKLRDGSDLAGIAMVRFALIELGAAQPQILLMAVHHAVWDPITVGIFFDDLRTVYDQAARGRDLRLPPKTSSVKLWAERMQAQGPSAVADELGYWRERLADDALVLPLDGAAVEPDEFAGIRDLVTFTSQETRAVQRVVQENCDATVEEILLAVVAIAVTKWTGKRKVGINLIRHGRDRLLEGVDVSRTVGWFSNDFPVILDLTDAQRAVDAVRIARNAVRAVPRNGIGYPILRYLDPARPLAGHAPPRIMLNYLGAGTVPMTGPLRFLGLDQSLPSREILRSPHAPIQVTSRILSESLDTHWICNKTVVTKPTLHALAEGAAGALRQLIVECEEDARRNRV